MIQQASKALRDEASRAAAALPDVLSVVRCEVTNPADQEGVVMVRKPDPYRTRKDLATLAWKHHEGSGFDFWGGHYDLNRDEAHKDYEKRIRRGY